MGSHARRSLFSVFFVMSGLLVTSQLPAAADLTPQFEQAAQAFEKARAGSASAVEPAQAAFKRLLDQDGSNPLFMAYYGTTFAMQARDGGMPWKKIRLVNEGIGYIDRALN